MDASFTENIAAVFQENGNSQRAGQMKAYMKDRFAFYGINSPTVKSLLAAYFKQNGYPSQDELIDVLYDLWDYDEREMQYVGLRLIRKFVKKQDPEFINVLEDLIVRKSWWDTVDALSVDAGTLLLIHPKLQPGKTDGWMASDNLWLQRAAIIHQLMYKAETNWPMLKRYILATCHRQEFFLRKACGWALRQYSKTNPGTVKLFIERNRSKLSRLTISEGSKYL